MLMPRSSISSSAHFCVFLQLASCFLWRYQLSVLTGGTHVWSLVYGLTQACWFRLSPKATLNLRLFGCISSWTFAIINLTTDTCDTSSTCNSCAQTDISDVPNADPA
ncbi:hypothetical protein BKA93DRAFT_796835 [Sparassis latifolia]